MSITIGDLKEEDLARGFLATLAGLGTVDLSPEEAAAIFKERRRSGARTFVARAENRPVGTATLWIERKFYHREGAGHIEDVAVHPDHQGQGIGASLVKHALEEAKRLGCYKVILNCAERLLPFYTGLGFRRHDNGMRLDF